MLIAVKGNEVKLYGRIWEGDGAYISNQLEKLEGSDWLKIRLHTNGGSVIDGNLIRDAIINLKHKTHLIIEGLAASMGAILLTGADKVTIRKNAFIMIHEPQGGARGTADDLKAVANVLSEMRKNFISDLSKRTGKPEAAVSKWLNGDNWFSASQALKEGLVDGIEDSIFKDGEMKALREMKITADLKIPSALQSTFDLPDAITPEELPKGQNTEQTKTNKYRKMKQEVINAFGLAGLTAESSDSAVIAALKEKVTGLENKVTEKTTELKALKDKQEAALEASINKSVADAIALGKITEDQKDTYLSIGKSSGIDALENVFSAMQGRKSIADAVVPNGGGSVAGIPEARKDWSWDKWQKEDSEGLEALASGTEEQKKVFNALYKGKFKRDFE